MFTSSLSYLSSKTSWCIHESQTRECQEWLQNIFMCLECGRRVTPEHFSALTDLREQNGTPWGHRVPLESHLRNCVSSRPRFGTPVLWKLPPLKGWSHYIPLVRCLPFFGGDGQDAHSIDDLLITTLRAGCALPFRWLILWCLSDDFDARAALAASCGYGGDHRRYPFYI